METNQAAEVPGPPSAPVFAGIEAFSTRPPASGVGVKASSGVGPGGDPATSPGQCRQGPELWCEDTTDPHRQQSTSQHICLLSNGPGKAALLSLLFEELSRSLLSSARSLPALGSHTILTAPLCFHEL